MQERPVFRLEGAAYPPTSVSAFRITRDESITHRPPCTGISVAARAWRRVPAGRPHWPVRPRCRLLLRRRMRGRRANPRRMPRCSRRSSLTGDARQVSAPYKASRPTCARGHQDRHGDRRGAAGPVGRHARTDGPAGRAQRRRQPALYAGAYADSRPGGVLESVFLRGFGGFAAAAINPQMLDGLPLPKGVNWAASVVDPWTLERIDVLRGPASVLYGQAAGRHRRHGQQAAHARCAAPARRADRQPRSRAACI